MYKPNILCYSSLIYIVPFLLSIVNTFPVYLSVGVGASVVCSQLCHGFYHDPGWRAILRPIDMVVCHSVVVMHVWVANTVCSNPFTWNIIVMYVSIAYAAMTYWVLGKSTSYAWHVALHLITGMGSTAFMLGPQ